MTVINVSNGSKYKTANRKFVFMNYAGRCSALQVFYCFSIYFLLTLTPTAAYADSQSQEQINTLTLKLIETYQAKSVPTGIKKVAILPLDTLTPRLQQGQVGRAVSEMLIQSFSKSSLFQVIERDKLGSIFKELALNASGGIDPEDAKRIGRISGADFLLLGSVLDAEQQLLTQARLVDVETGEIIAAESIYVNKSALFKEAEEYYHKKIWGGVYALGGVAGFSDLKFKSSGIGAEIYYILSPGRVLSLELFQTLGVNSESFKDSQTQVTTPFPSSFPLGIKETINSVFLASLQYRFLNSVTDKTRLYLGAGPGLYVLNSEQEFFYAPDPGAQLGGLDLPAKTSRSYVVPGLSVTLGVQKYFTPSIRCGLFYSLGFFSFKRKLDPGTGNQTLVSQIDHLNTNVNVSGHVIGGRIAINFGGTP
ncbi:MAG: FlgO family outer membrane protein [Nitrospiraceae bacterium]|nr:FlgO family outer membrane protein [Nitrospiraceae bacterium]